MMPYGTIIALVLVLAGAALADGITTSGGVIPGQVPGTTTNNNAGAGNVGEIIQSTVATGSAVSLTTATPANVTSVSLTAGDWDCRATIARNVGATTSFTRLSGSLGTASAVLVADGTEASAYFATAANVMAAGTDTQIGPTRFSLASTTTVFLVAQDTFTVSTDAAYGQLTCRRAR